MITGSLALTPIHGWKGLPTEAKPETQRLRQNSHVRLLQRFRGTDPCGFSSVTRGEQDGECSQHTVLSSPTIQAGACSSAAAFPQASTREGAHGGAYVHKAPTQGVESANSFTGSEALMLLSQVSNRLSLSTLVIMLSAEESLRGKAEELQFRGLEV